MTSEHYTLHCIMHNVHCTMTIVHCTMYIKHYIVYSIHCTVYIVYSITTFLVIESDLITSKVPMSCIEVHIVTVK